MHVSPIEWAEARNRLDDLRLERDISYPELAAEIGVHPMTLHKLLNNAVHGPRDRTMHKIRKYLRRLDEPTPITRRRKAAAR